MFLAHKFSKKYNGFFFRTGWDSQSVNSTPTSTYNYESSPYAAQTYLHTSPASSSSLQSQANHAHAYKTTAYSQQQMHQPTGYEFFNSGQSAHANYASNPGFQAGYANVTGGSGAPGSNTTNNFWWSKLQQQQQQNTQTPVGSYNSVNYSTPISGYSASNSFEGLHQYNNLIRNLHSSQANAKIANNSSSSTSSSPNSSSSSTATATSSSSACLSSSLTSHLNSLVEQGNRMSYQSQQLQHSHHHDQHHHHMLPITPDESNTDISSSSSSILNYSSQRQNSKLVFFIYLSL